MSLVIIETNAREVEGALRLTAGELNTALQITEQTAAREALRLFQQTTATWEHQVDFETVEAMRSDGFEVLIGTDDPIYAFVDQGTKEHIIAAKDGGVLAFPWGGPGSYTAKTKPGKIGSTAGGPSGSTVFRRFVIHPGTKARGFTALIQKEVQKFATKQMERQVDRALTLRWQRGFGRRG